jgi:hypothetical protein
MSSNPEDTPTMALKRQIDELQSKLTEHAEIVEHLRSLPESEAIAMVRRFRSTPNTSTVLSTVRGAVNTTARLSELKSSRARVPPTKSDVEFELSVLHRSVYPILTPLKIGSIDPDRLFCSDFHTSNTPTTPSETQLSVTQFADAELSVAPATVLLSPLQGTQPYGIVPVLEPAPTRNYCDSRLNHLHIEYWTRISISDELAARVISYHLEANHSKFACVDADLFLSSLVDRKLEYCSPFLVCALMGIACVRSIAF